MRRWPGTWEVLGMFTVEWSCRQEKSKICTLGVSPSKCKCYGAVNKALDVLSLYCFIYKYLNMHVCMYVSFLVDLDWTEVYEYIECETDGESAISAPLPRPTASNLSIRISDGEYGRKLFETNNVSEIKEASVEFLPRQY